MIAERVKVYKGDAVIANVNGVKFEGTVLKCYSRTLYVEDSRKNLHLLSYEQAEKKSE